MSFQAPFPLQQKQHGMALLKAQRAAEAKALFQQVCRDNERDHEAWFLLGAANGLLDAYDQAEACFRRAIMLRPDLPEGFYNLGKALQQQHKFTDAAACYQRSLRLIADKGGAIPARYADAFCNLGNAHKDMGRVGEAIECYRQALVINPQDNDAHSCLLFSLNYHPGTTRAEVYDEHRRWDEQHARRLLPEIAVRTDPDPERRLRVGYVSADFRAHAVAKFVEPLLAAHDHSRFEVFGYANVKQPDAVTQRLQGYCDQWRDISGLSDDAAAQLVRDDRIDILIDLIGHTAGSRLLVFARKPAPLQMSYVGYPNTSGLSAMDYRFATPRTDPPGETGQYYSEQLVYLDSHFCYQPWSDTPLPNRLPALENGFITFASLNNLAKITPEVTALWARVLTTVPGARLVLKARGLSDVAAQNSVRAAFGAHGIAPGRLSLFGWGLLPEYLACFQQADIGLDPFPFNGGTTTYNSLWMGLPVITLAGQSFMARTGLSILSSLGLEDLAAHSEQEYVAIAARLAGDLDRLQALRAGLRERMQASPLTDGPGYARGFEKALRDCWRVWCSQAGVQRQN